MYPIDFLPFPSVADISLYCSFQRGTNERTNALVSRFIPKGNSMKNVHMI